MTKYNGQTITYDAIGNPLSYRDGISLTWQNGRELASFTNADTSVSYTYDASGMRTSKTLTSDGATDTVKYVYENGLLLQMQYNHMYFDFIYDANGNPVSMAYRSTVTSSPIYYYYGLNSRGDVIALYYNTGALYAKYTYDVYGKLLSITNSSGSPINTKYSPAKLNPLRYRGYVYDTETELYYLQSRYYDPTICRFINEDIYYDTGVGFTGLNMFAYCNNNPVMYCDTFGTYQTYTVLTMEGKTYSGVPCYSLGCYGQLKDYWVDSEVVTDIDYGFTYSNGLSVSVNVGPFGFSGSIGVTFDTSGDIQIQTSCGYVLTSAMQPGISVVSYNMYTLTPSADNLLNEGYQVGIGVACPIPKTPMNAVAESNLVILPIDNSTKKYYGYCECKGISLPKGKGMIPNAHGSISDTKKIWSLKETINKYF